MNRFLLLTLIFFISVLGFSQTNYKALMNDNSVNFYDVCKAADTYFLNHKKGKGSGWKGYQRWKNENESKYAPSGRRDNVNPYFAADNFKNYAFANHGRRSRYPSGWKDLGPYRIDSITGHYSTGLGRVVASYVHKKNVKIMYIGSRSGGFWKTTDGGKNWKGTTDYLAASGVGSITAKPNDANFVLIGVQNGSNRMSHGIYKSINGGDTWKESNFNPTKLGKGGLGSFFRINVIKFHPRVANLVFVGTNDGLYRSTDALVTWTKISTISRDISQIEFHPIDNNIMYIVRNYGSDKNKVLRSMDQGLTFSKSATIPNNNNGRGYLSVSNDCSDCIYFASSNGVWISKDTAKTFTFLSNPPQSCLGFAVDDTDTSNMVYGYVDVVTSKDGGRTFKQVTWWSLGSSPHGKGNFHYKLKNSGKYVHADLHPAISVNGIYYIGTDGFFCSSKDNGDSWKILNQGTGIREFYSLGTSQSNHYRSIAGSQDNGTSIKLEDTWIEFNGGDGMEGLVHPLNSDWMIGSFQFGSRYRTINAGQSRKGVTPKGQKAGWEAPILYDPNDHMQLYNFSQSVFRSKNFGTTWDSMGKPSFNGNISRAAIANNNSYIIAVTRGSAIELSTDSGKTFKSIKNNLPNYTITDVSFNPNNDSNIFVTYNRYQKDGKKIFMTTNLGASWTNITYNLGDMPIRCVVVDHSNASNIYLGAEIGVYTKPMNGKNWTLYNNNLPNSTIKDLEIVNGSNTLRAAIWGRGLWEYTLVNRLDYPAILKTKISDMPTKRTPKEGVDQFVTSLISYSKTLKKVYVKWSLNPATFSKSIAMTNTKDSTWVSSSPLPTYPVGTKIYFKVFAEGAINDITETFKFMYTIQPFEYCKASGSTASGNLFIENVSISKGVLNNNSTNNKDTFYVNKVVKLQQESTYSISVKSNPGWSNHDCEAWIDFNKNATFDNGEALKMSKFKNRKSNATFTVPTLAILDDTLRLRVRLSYWGSPQTCGKTFGEVEDYPLVIKSKDFEYTIIDKSICTGENIGFKYTGFTLDSIRWEFDNGTKQYHANLDKGTINNPEVGNYSMVLKGYKNGKEFKKDMDSAFTVSDTQFVVLNLKSCKLSDVGTVFKHLKNGNGCDSTVKIITKYIPVDSVIIHNTSCNILDTGTVINKYKNTKGCDSVVTTITGFIGSAPVFLHNSSCSALDSGTVVEKLKNINGCDSVVTTYTKYIGTKAYVLVNKKELTAMPASMAYQWMDCDDNFKEINNETKQILTATKNGSYAVRVTNSNNCVDTSDCAQVKGIGIIENTFNEKIKVYPNPTSGKIIIEFTNTYSDLRLQTTNELGQLIIDKQVGDFQSVSVNLENYSAGIYYLTLSSGDKIVKFKIMKE